MDRASEKLGWATFDDFYQVEYEIQIRRAFVLLGNEADAADAVAEAFTSVLKRWGTLFDPGPYLNVCVLNACRDIARKTRRLKAERIVVRTSDSSKVTDEVEMADLLLRLPFRPRAMLVLRYYGGMTEAEIAETLGCRPGSVGPTIHRALGKLKGALA